jgi:lipase
MIHSQRLGQAGGLPAVLVHCFMGHSGNWAGMLGAMEVPLEACAVDLPSHGRSGAWVAGSGDLQGQVAQHLDSIITAPSVLIGHSFGGSVVLRHALERRSNVQGVVLIEPVLFAAARNEPEAAGHAAAEAGIDAALARGDPAGAARLFLQMNDPGSDWDALPARARDTFTRQILLLRETVLQVRDDRPGLVAAGRLEGIDFPVLLIRGSQTPAIFHAIHRVLERRIPSVEAAVVEGAGHMVPISHPAQTAALIGDWLARKMKNPRVS